MIKTTFALVVSAVALAPLLPHQQDPQEEGETRTVPDLSKTISVGEGDLKSALEVGLEHAHNEPTAFSSVSKFRVEGDLKQSLDGFLTPPAAAMFFPVPDEWRPMSKDRVESDIEQSIGDDPFAVVSSFENRTDHKTRPGEVQWHSSFEAAVVAARRSGRPVMHFQLLGRLDDAFC